MRFILEYRPAPKIPGAQCKDVVAIGAREIFAA
jgi:hypothetical protein